MVFQSDRLHLRTLVRLLRKEISKLVPWKLTYPSTFKLINLSRLIYFRVSVPTDEVWLIWAGSEVIQSMMFSIDETKKIFQSIERAYDNQELVEVNVGDLLWKTDCRPRSYPDAVTISFKRGWERTREDVKRQDVASAIATFRSLF